MTEAAETGPRFVFLMCERVEVLERLRVLEVSGVPHVNTPRAVHNTYRDRMIAVLDEANVPFIASRIVGTSEPPEPGALPVWVKRGDVHNTQEGDVVRASTARLSLALTLMTAAAAITLVLGTIGLYGVMAYMVALRTREFGVRVALGADPRQIARAVAKRGLVLVAGGVAAGST